MQYIAPLLQTGLWVGLIGYVIWRFHDPLYGLLLALQKRVEGGSSIKIGPLEVMDQMRPQVPEKQKQKVEAELEEANLLDGTSSLDDTGKPPGLMYFQAEDLALRAIQAEYGRPISRQLTAGSDTGFDGVFIVNGRAHIVEVKYIRDTRTIARLRKSLQGLVDVILKYNWKNVQIILAVVFERGEDIPSADFQLLHAVEGLALPVSIRSFALKELQKSFGLVDTAKGG